VRKGVLYGGRESYHHMCRYFSGFFQLHPLLADVDFYWRVEPDVHFYCDLAYDPFRYMRQQCVSVALPPDALCLATSRRK
jgi:Glycolipid 2-alpha-mannosyltransferase